MAATAGFAWNPPGGGGAGGTVPLATGAAWNPPPGGGGAEGTVPRGTGAFVGAAAGAVSDVISQCLRAGAGAEAAAGGARFDGFLVGIGMRIIGALGTGAGAVAGAAVPPPPSLPPPCAAAFASFCLFFQAICSNIPRPGGGFLFQGGPYCELPPPAPPLPPPLPPPPPCAAAPAGPLVSWVSVCFSFIPPWIAPNNAPRPPPPLPPRGLAADLVGGGGGPGGGGGGIGGVATTIPLQLAVETIQPARDHF